MPKMIQLVETWAGTAVTDVEQFLETGWAELKPAIIAMGHTVESQVETAAAAYVAALLTGNPLAFSDSLKSIMDQLVGDAKELESIVAGWLSTSIAAKLATPAAAS